MTGVLSNWAELGLYLIWYVADILVSSWFSFVSHFICMHLIKAAQTTHKTSVFFFLLPYKKMQKWFSTMSPVFTFQPLNRMRAIPHFNASGWAKLRDGINLSVTSSFCLSSAVYIFVGLRPSEMATVSSSSLQKKSRAANYFHKWSLAVEYKTVQHRFFQLSFHLSLTHGGVSFNSLDPPISLEVILCSFVLTYPADLYFHFYYFCFDILWFPEYLLAVYLK